MWDRRSPSRWSPLLLAAVLVGAGLVIPSGPVSADPAPCTVESDTEAEALAEAARCDHPVLVSGLTTESLEARALPSGRIEATVSAGVARVRRGASWVPLDLALHRAEGDTIVPGAHPNDLVMAGARAVGTHELAAVGRGESRVAMRWTGALRAPVLAGPRATYIEALPGVDLVVEATPEGFEQLLVVKSRAAVARVARIPMAMTGPRCIALALAS